MRPEVELGTPDDQEAVRQFVQRLYPSDSFERVTGAVRYEAKTLIARMGRAVVGLAFVAFIDYGLHPYGELLDMAVDEDPEDSSVIGVSLIHSAMEWLRERGGETIVVLATSRAGLYFHRDIGFDRFNDRQLIKTIPQSPPQVARLRPWPYHK